MEENHLGFSKKLVLQRGITTIEVLICSVVLLSAIMGAVAITVTAEKKSQDVQNKLLAMGSARSLMEEIKTTPLQDIFNLDHQKHLATDLPSGTISVTTSPSNLTGLDIATVTVTVTWVGAQNRVRAFDLSSLKSKYGRVT